MRKNGDTASRLQRVKLFQQAPEATLKQENLLAAYDLAMPQDPKSQCHVDPKEISKTDLGSIRERKVAGP